MGTSNDHLSQCFGYDFEILESFIHHKMVETNKKENLTKS